MMQNGRITSSFSVARRVANYSKYKPLEEKLIGAMEESHTKQQFPETVSETELWAKRSKSAGLRARTRERESKGEFFLKVGDDVVWRDKSGGPRGDHNPPGRAWGSWRAQVGCAHLVRRPLILFAPEILKYSQKIVLNFQSILRTFIFGSFFYCTGKFRKQTKHVILFYLTNKNRKQKVGTESSAY